MKDLLSHLISFFFFGRTHGMWKFPGQRMNPYHSSDLSHCSDNAGSLTQLVSRSHKRGAVFPARQLTKMLHNAINQHCSDDLLSNTVTPLLDITDHYLNGLDAHEHSVFVNFLEEYYNIEKLFNSPNVRDENVILKLRDENSDNLEKVVLIVLSHSKVSAKNNLILAILKHYQPLCKMSSEMTAIFSAPLQHIVELQTKDTAKVALQPREIFIQGALSSVKERTEQVEHILRSSIVKTAYSDSHPKLTEPDMQILNDLIDSNYVVFDVLMNSLIHPDPAITAAVQVYA